MAVNGEIDVSSLISGTEEFQSAANQITQAANTMKDAILGVQKIKSSNKIKLKAEYSDIEKANEIIDELYEKTKTPATIDVQTADGKIEKQANSNHIQRPGQLSSYFQTYDSAMNAMKMKWNDLIDHMNEHPALSFDDMIDSTNSISTTVVRFANAFEALGGNIGEVSSELADFVNKMRVLPQLQAINGNSFTVDNFKKAFEYFEKLRIEAGAKFNGYNTFEDIEVPLKSLVRTTEQAATGMSSSISSMESDMEDFGESTSGGMERAAKQTQKAADKMEKAYESVEEIKNRVRSSYQSLNIYDDDSYNMNADWDKEIENSEERVKDLSNILDALLKRKKQLEGFLSDDGIDVRKYNTAISNNNTESISSSIQEIEEDYKNLLKVDEQIEYIQGALKESVQNFKPGDAWGASEIQALIQLLQELVIQVKNVTNAFGMVDEESGVTTLLSQMKTLGDVVSDAFSVDKIDAFKNAIGSIAEQLEKVYGSIGSDIKNRIPDQNTLANTIIGSSQNGGASGPVLNENIRQAENKVYKRYQQAYETTLRYIQGLGYNLDKIITGYIDKFNVADDPEKLKEFYNKRAIENIPKFEDRINRIIQFIKMVDSIADDLMLPFEIEGVKLDYSEEIKSSNERIQKLKKDTKKLYSKRDKIKEEDLDGYAWSDEYNNVIKEIQENVSEISELEKLVQYYKEFPKAYKEFLPYLREGKYGKRPSLDISDVNNQIARESGLVKDTRKAARIKEAEAAAAPKIEITNLQTLYDKLNESISSLQSTLKSGLGLESIEGEEGKFTSFLSQIIEKMGQLEQAAKQMAEALSGAMKDISLSEDGTNLGKKIQDAIDSQKPYLVDVKVNEESKLANQIKDAIDSESYKIKVEPSKPTKQKTEREHEVIRPTSDGGMVRHSIKTSTGEQPETSGTTTAINATGEAAESADTSVNRLKKDIEDLAGTKPVNPLEKMADDGASIIGTIQEAINAGNPYQIEIKPQTTLLDAIQTMLDGKEFQIKAGVSGTGSGESPAELITQMVGADAIMGLVSGKSAIKERGMAFNSRTGYHTNPFIFDDHGSFSSKLTDTILSNVSEDVDTWMHTHPELYPAFSLSNKKQDGHYSGDLRAAYSAYKNKGIKTEINAAQNQVAVFDAQKFYDMYGNLFDDANIDNTMEQIYKARLEVEEKFKKSFKSLADVFNIESFDIPFEQLLGKNFDVPELAPKFKEMLSEVWKNATGDFDATSFTRDFMKYINTLPSDYSGSIKDVFTEYIRKTFSDLSIEPGEIEKYLGDGSDFKTAIGLAFERWFGGLMESNTYKPRIQQLITPEILQKSLGIADFDKNFMQYLSIDRFKQAYSTAIGSTDPYSSISAAAIRAASAKQDFAGANREAAGSVDPTTNKLKEEELEFNAVADAAKNAADAKDQFADANKNAAEGAAQAEKERVAAGGQGDTSGADAQTKANEKLTESAKEAADAEKKKINVGEETANHLSEKKRGIYVNQKVDDNDAAQYSYTEWLGYAQRRLVQQRIVGYNDENEPIYNETSVTSTNFEQIEKETIRVDALILKLQADLEKGINLGKPTKAIEDMLALAEDYSEELGTELKKYYDEQGYLPGSEHIQKYLVRHQNAMAQTEAQIQRRRDDEFYKSQQKRNKEIEDTDALIMKQEQKLDQLKKKYVDNANVELPDKALKNLELRYNSIMTETGRLQKQGSSSKVERESLEGMIKEYQRYAQQSIKDQKIASNLEADSPKVAKARLEENITRLLNKMKQTAMDTTEYERQLQGISDELNKPENAEKIKLPVYLKKKRNDFKEIEQKYKAGQNQETDLKKQIEDQMKIIENAEKLKTRLNQAEAAEARGRSAGEDVATLKEEVKAAGEAADVAKGKIDDLLKSSGNKKLLGEDAVKDIQEKAETKLERSKKGSVSSVKALDNAGTAAQTKEIKRQLSAYEKAQKEYFNLYSQSLSRSLTSEEEDKKEAAGRTMVELEKQWNEEKAKGISLSEKQEQVSKNITSNAQKTKNGNEDFSKNQLKQIAVNKEAFDLYNNIQSKIAKMSNQSGWRAAGWDDQVEKLRGQLEAVGKPQDIFDEAGLDKYRQSLQEVFKSYQEISKSSDWQPVAKDWQAKARNNLQSWMNSNKKAAQAYKEELKELEVTIDSIEGKGGAEEWNAKFQSIQQDALSKGLTGKTLGDRFKEQFSNTMTSLATYYLSFQDFIRYGREAISIVTELDTQLTEMRKVSNESLSSLKNYQLETFDIANQVGTTAAQIQSSTADWMRLGKELPEAKQMAALSTKLLNVSEFTDIKDATDALVSATQAYQEVTANDIVDKLNIIGNNYAVSTDELAQGLQNAGAVLKTQGNDLDKTLALLTAGNKLPGNTEMYLFEYI